MIVGTEYLVIGQRIMAKRAENITFFTPAWCDITNANIALSAGHLAKLSSPKPGEKRPLPTGMDWYGVRVATGPAGQSLYRTFRPFRGAQN